MGKVVAVLNSKGGVGKSTIAASISAVFASIGTTCILDADPQSSAANWVDERDYSEIEPRISVVQKTGRIKNTIKDLSEQYDYVVVDVAGRNSDEMISAMIAADVVAIPFTPSKLALDAMGLMQKLLSQVEDLNPSLKVVTFLNMCNPSITHRLELADWTEYLEQYDEYVIAAPIFDRKVFRDSMITGNAVSEMGNKKAIEEIKELVKVILS